uniref:Ig-like domain-containing protein n=1 Tax=Dicentrarchus labrax TaxID=13489 RepID=A0A8P4KMY0_DICLA
MPLYTILCGVFHLSVVIQSAAVQQDTGVIFASVGDNVTLHCSYDSQVAMHFSWYQQTLGGGPKLLSSVYKHNPHPNLSPEGEKPPPSLGKKKKGNHLHISDVHLSDSATYFCGSSHSNIMEFGKGKDSASVHESPEIVQRPVSETIQPGGSVTFNCTVHTGSCGSRQGILHPLGDGWKHVSAPGSPHRSSDAGTCYCAVASCGEILFGDGSKLLVQGAAEDQMRILVWLSIIRTGVLLLFVTTCHLFYINKSR